MAVHYLVDGYNVIYAFPEIPPGTWQEKRLALLKFLQQRRPQGNNPLTVVFDNREGAGNTYQERGLTVVFTSSETADDWLSAEVRRAANPRILIVVSNDQGIRAAIRGTGARFLSVSEFLRNAASEPARSETPPEKTSSKDAEITEEFKRKWL